ncbi:DUF397 domain-containing protein [Streptomyces sp. A3M-1-3]|uniref:DUF397 domain-containing protein n=1 Tax=Streptomyces sp. A3M-1-3 TaxID=2962044 RepID=UPI0020B6AE78|nr:DUF397 domain-containing protein [Streptomyces sp. A3M-1-3]MCP3818919.1 DUF397 domain-containing protein [Streptomyces sp. A3M-1-3]
MSTELTWFKSSYSGGDGGQCVEVAIAWHKSSYSDGSGGQCVEVAACPGIIHIRDSKNTARPGLSVTSEAWSAFAAFAASREVAPR